MGKLFCMGDIHGHDREFSRRLAQLENLCDPLGAEGADKLVLLGDYIDGGPDSGGVLRRIFQLQKSRGRERVIVLRGNHEEMLLEWLDVFAGPPERQRDEYGWPLWSNWLDTDEDFQTFRTLITPSQWAFFRKVAPTLSEESLNVTAAKMVLENDRELIRWLRGLPYYYETDRQIFVHAGIDEEAGEYWRLGTPEHTFVWKYPAAFGPFSKDIVAGHIGTASLSGDRDFHDIFWDGESHYYCDGTVSASGHIPVLVYDGEKKRYYSLWPDSPSRGSDAPLRRQVRGELIPLEKPKEMFDL